AALLGLVLGGGRQTGPDQQQPDGQDDHPHVQLSPCVLAEIGPGLNRPGRGTTHMIGCATDGKGWSKFRHRPSRKSTVHDPSRSQFGLYLPSRSDLAVIKLTGSMSERSSASHEGGGNETAHRVADTDGAGRRIESGCPRPGTDPARAVREDPPDD